MTLRNVLPSFTADQHADIRASDAVHQRKLLMGDATSSVSFPDGSHIIGGQSGERVRFSDVPRCAGVSSFTRSVIHVVLMRAEFQVRRVYACAVVALMENVQTVWNRAVRQFPCDPMRLSVLSLDRNCTVSETEPGRLPLPTLKRGAAVNLRPESVSERGSVSTVGHGILLPGLMLSTLISYLVPALCTMGVYANS